MIELCWKTKDLSGFSPNQAKQQQNHQITLFKSTSFFFFFSLCALWSASVLKRLCLWEQNTLGGISLYSRTTALSRELQTNMPRTPSMDNCRVRLRMICRPHLSQLLIAPKLPRHSCVMPSSVIFCMERGLCSLKNDFLEQIPISTCSRGLLRRGQQIAFNLLFAFINKTNLRCGLGRG